MEMKCYNCKKTFGQHQLIYIHNNPVCSMECEIKHERKKHLPLIRESFIKHTHTLTKHRDTGVLSKKLLKYINHQIFFQGAIIAGESKQELTRIGASLKESLIEFSEEAVESYTDVDLLKMGESMKKIDNIITYYIHIFG
jgi:hypothetical protein